ncbi:unnamed protein product, partial [Amoebophrya sp. A25]
QGVGGIVPGRFGTLKPNVLGSHLKAIFAKDLPVDRLISVGGLNSAGWRVVFGAVPEGSHLEHKYLRVPRVNLQKSAGGLPYLQDLCFEENSASSS